MSSIWLPKNSVSGSLSISTCFLGESGKEYRLFISCPLISPTFYWFYLRLKSCCSSSVSHYQSSSSSKFERLNALLILILFGSNFVITSLISAPVSTPTFCSFLKFSPTWCKILVNAFYRRAISFSSYDTLDLIRVCSSISGIPSS